MPRMLTISCRIGERTFHAIDHDEVIEAAAVVAVEHHEPCLAPPIPDHVADRILYEQVDVVRMIVRPVHRDEQFELGSILPASSFGLMAKSAMKNRNAST